MFVTVQLYAILNHIGGLDGNFTNLIRFLLRLSTCMKSDPIFTASVHLHEVSNKESINDHLRVDGQPRSQPTRYRNKAALLGVARLTV